MTPGELAIIWPLCFLALVTGLLTGHHLVQLHHRYRANRRELAEVKRSLRVGMEIRAAEAQRATIENRSLRSHTHQNVSLGIH